MNLWRKPILALGLATLLTLATSEVGTTTNATYPDIMGCESACSVVAGGWPFPYLVDSPGISPLGSVSLIGVVLGVDEIRPAELATTFLFWLALSALAVWAVSRKRQERTLPPVR